MEIVSLLVPVKAKAPAEAVLRSLLPNQPVTVVYAPPTRTAPPLLMLMVPVLLGRAAAPVKSSRPLLTWVLPVKAFVPERTTVPRPPVASVPLPLIVPP